jgi:hypothetical protein
MKAEEKLHQELRALGERPVADAEVLAAATPGMHRSSAPTSLD